jgi:hypothetical protein
MVSSSAQTAIKPRAREKQLRQRLAIVAAALGGLLAVIPGCGDGGPRRYEVSGQVTYDGKPVPTGYLYFEPDKSQGNDGPGTQIGLSDGQYKTAPGRGVIGGPHIVTITGLETGPESQSSGPAAAGPDASPFGPDVKVPNFKLLFPPVKRKVDLPRKDAVEDFHLRAGENP